MFRRTFAEGVLSLFVNEKKKQREKNRDIVTMKTKEGMLNKVEQGMVRDGGRLGMACEMHFLGPNA